VQQACRNTLSIKTFKPKSKFSKSKIHSTVLDILTISRKQEEEKTIAAIKENPKFFYKYAAKYSKT